MRQPAGPRVPIMSGNGAGVWIVVLAGWGLAAVTWLAWLAARIAAALAGGHVPSYGEHWVYTVLRGRTAQAWPGTPTVLVIVAGLILACAAAAAVAVAWRFIGRRIPRPGGPGRRAVPQPADRRAGIGCRGQERHPAAPVAGRGQPPQAVSRRYRAAARRPAQAVRPRPGPVSRPGKTPRSRSWRPARERPPRSPSRTSCPRPARSPRPASARTCGPRPASCAPGPAGRCGCSIPCG